MSRDELVAFFDFCDAQVAGRRALRRKGSLAALRDAALFKTIYAWGLRRPRTQLEPAALPALRA